MTLIDRRYNREAAVDYAKKWANSRNPKYFDFDALGGDCTNFASQCLYAGSQIMNYTPQYGWYYINANKKSPSWTGVPYFYNFLISNKGIGPHAESSTIDKMQIGDFIQLGSENGFYHSLIIIRIEGMPKESSIYIACHTTDCFDRVLSSYYYEKIRYIHIEGVRS